MTSLAEKLETKDSCPYTDITLDEIIKERINIKPIAIIMVGSPGSGKSSLKKKFVENYLGRRMDEFIDCDPDVTLTYLKKLHAAADKPIDCYYNSREINDILYTYAQKQHLNLILDGTGQDYIWTTGQIENLYQSGYLIYICIVTVKIDLSLSRAKTREIKTGRVVPESEIIAKNKFVDEAIPFYIKNKRAHQVIVYDNSGEKSNATFKVYVRGAVDREGNEKAHLNTGILLRTESIGGRRKRGRRKTIRKLKKRRKTIRK